MAAGNDESNFMDSILSSVVSKPPNVRFDDIAGLQFQKAELMKWIVLPISHPEIFHGDFRKPPGILLFGVIFVHDTYSRI